MRGKRMSKKFSQKSFRRGARNVHEKNIRPSPLRGGFRL